MGSYRGQVRPLHSVMAKISEFEMLERVKFNEHSVLGGWHSTQEESTSCALCQIGSDAKISKG